MFWRTEQPGDGLWSCWRPVSLVRLLLSYERKSDAVRGVVSWERVGNNWIFSIIIVLEEPVVWRLFVGGNASQ